MSITTNQNIPAQTTTSLNRLYLATGRVEGDDEDTARIIEADSCGHAESILERHLLDEGAEAKDVSRDEVTVYVNYAISLQDAIAQRLV